MAEKGGYKVIRIALVEDDRQYRTQLNEYITRYAAASGREICVTQFSDGDEIALRYKAEYDIILMDIEMIFMDGMTAAEEIRQKDQDVVIIFITNSPQYAIKGYAVDALDYVLKPVSYFAFSQRLERAIARMKRREEKYFTLTTRDGTHRIAYSHLYYVESGGHDLFYHTAEGVLQTTGSMREAENQFAGEHFARCNQCYLINLQHAEAVVEDEVVVHGEKLRFSRSRKKSFLEALNRYFAGESK